MSTPPTSAGGRERKLLEAARGGDEDAFRRLVEPHRSELHAHCYRMLGSAHDADDALQDALLRAWRGLAKFEGRSSLRTWLYRITTNACLDAIARRPKRVLPVDYGPAADPADGPDEPLVESVWIEPYADERLGLEDGYAAPEARYERRESVELAFIAALQHLPATQRAVLILRDVLGFSAKETAESLDTTVASARSSSVMSMRGSKATSTRSSRCWRKTQRSRCRRFEPGIAATTRSRSSSRARRSAIGGASCRLAPTGSWRSAPTPGMRTAGAT